MGKAENARTQKLALSPYHNINNNNNIVARFYET